MNVTIRSVTSQDRAEWERLYALYAQFYRVEQTPQMRELVWTWLHDAAQEIEGLVAAGENGLVGLAHFRPFTRPLRASTAGFLDDLFVDPGMRGRGVADLLIQAIAAEGRKRGWSVIRWITAEDNYRARAVYDRLAERTNWLTYDIKLE